MSKPKLLFVATEDWFFHSHFMPLAARARAEGYEVLLAARSSGVLDGEDGIQLIDMRFSRRSLRPWDVGRQVGALKALIEREKPVLVHAIALKPIALLLLTNCRGFGRVLAVTGRGYLSLGRAPWTRIVSWRLRRMLRRELRKPGAVLLVENETDRFWVEYGEALDGNSVLMPGAGVDADRFKPAPEPAAPPVVIGIVARLIWSKGVDLAVAAVRNLRAEGSDVRLRIAGAADPQNVAHVSDAVIESWRGTDGVALLGKVDDVNGFWAAAHIACLPSRGGEGLPRALLEAGACGRPIVTSDAPGCADFVRHGEMGLVVRRDDVAALTDALRTLVLDADARKRMGAAARQRVIDSYTETHAGAQASEAWRLARGAP